MRVLLLFCLWLPGLAASAQQPGKHELFQRMFAAIGKVRTLTFELDQSERIGGKMMTGSQTAKLNCAPFKVYLKVLAPDPGTELLYVAGGNGGKVKLNPGRSPHIVLNLDPDSGLLRKGRHHSVKEIGFGYVGGLLKNVYDRYRTNIDEWVQFKGEVVHHGRTCWSITFTNGDYALRDVTTGHGENVIAVARRTFTNEYELLELNGLKNYDAVEPGRSLKVPDTYFKSVDLYIDQATCLPVYQKMYDAKGVFAVYDYKDLRVNPVIAPEEFTTGYKGYGF